MIGTKWANGILLRYNDAYIDLKDNQDQIDAKMEMLVEKSKLLKIKANKYSQHCSELNQTFKVN